MIKKSICWVLLIALTNYLFVSCRRTSQFKLLSEEITTTISSENITGVVTVKGDRYTFKQYGRYVDIPYLIKGLLTNGREYSISLENKALTEIRNSRVEIVPASQASGKDIKEIILTNYRGSRIRWENVRWDYDLNSNKLTGRDDGGIRYQMDADSIYEIRLAIPDTISMAKLIANPEIPVTEVKVGPSIYTFDQFGAQLEKNRKVIEGITELSGKVEIEVEDILYVMVERTDPTKTFFAFMGGLVLVLGVAFIIAAAAKQSCPFVYSYDGEKYIFDAEPLGGAVSKGLQKVDYSRLEHLKPVASHYKLIFRNEVRETQFLDQIKLLVIDHDPGITVIPGIDGKFYQIPEAVTTGSYIDENGESLDLFLSQNDGLIWQTYMPRGADSEFRNDRHEIIMKFPKPKGVESANLIFNGGTALWGSNMIREMLQLRGDKLDDWYGSINSFGSEYTNLVHFTLREELYVLNLYARDGKYWRHLNYIGGGGPLITEDRIIPMDLSWLREDTLTLKISPPQGFWQIDFMAVEYGKKIVSDITELTEFQALDHEGNDVSATLMKPDDVFHEMPNVGDWFKVDFKAPDPITGKQRSIFLKTDGYYELHIDKTIPEQTELVNDIMNIPGKILKYSQKRYFEWTKEQIGFSQVP